MDIIQSAPFSFIRFEHPTDTDYSLDIAYSLPVFSKHDLAFQFIVRTDRDISQSIKLGIADPSGAVLSVFAPDVFASILTYRYRFTGLLATAIFELTSIVIGAVTKNYGGRTVTPAIFGNLLRDDFGVELIDDYIVSDVNQSVIISATSGGAPTSFSDLIPPVWHQGYVAISNTVNAQTTCFTYCLVDADDGLLGYSNQFKPTDEEAYTSLVTYGCDSDAFGFVYPNGSKANTIRLPIYLLRPVFPSKSKVYQRSNGISKLLTASVSKQYDLITEQMPEVFHEAMKMMLSHDSIVIDNVNIREKIVEVLEADNYTPQWEADESLQLQYAQAKAKVIVATFGYTNSNC